MTVEKHVRNYGSTYKFIRQAKKISQLKVTKETMSRSALSKFEHNKQTIYLDNFLNLVEELQLSVPEFLFINNDYTFMPRDQLKDKFYCAHFKGDLCSCGELSKEIDHYLKSNPDWYLEKKKEYIDILINLENDTRGEQFKKVESLAFEIWKRIDKNDEWFMNDLQLLNIIIYYLPKNIRQRTLTRMLARLEDYKELDRTEVVLSSFQLNISLIYIQEGQLDKAAKIADPALKSAHNNRRYDIYIVGLIRKGIATKNFLLIHEGIQLAYQLKDQRLLHLLNIEIINNLPSYFTKHPEDIKKIQWQKEHSELLSFNINGYYWFAL